MINFLKSKTAKAAVGLFAIALMFAVSVNTASAAITTTLRKGMKGAQVAELQTGLNAMGFANPALVADGSFGAKTDVAVKAYQAAKGLVADGIFGAKSRAAWTGTTTGGTLPAGCTSTSLYSATTGLPCSSGTTTPQTGPVTAMLSSDTPASSVLVATQTGAVLSKFTFSGNGTVTTLNLQQSGVSADTTLSNVYLFDGNTRLTDAATVSSNRMINFTNASGLFSVSGTRTISVVAEIASGTSGQTVGANLVSFQSAGATAVTTAGIAGNVHSIAAATLASVDFATATPSGGSIDPAKDVEVWKSTASVGQRDVVLSYLTLRQIGSVNNGDIENFRLQVDGVTVATASNLDASGYVTFNVSPTKTLMTGSRVFRVLADVNAGSSRTFQFSARNKSDVGLRDSQYGVGITATYASGNFPAGPTSPVSINSGTVTVQKASDSPSANITVNGNDVVLAKYTLTTYGESLKIETIKAGFTSSNGAIASLRNGRIVINGTQVGSTTTLAATGTTYTTNYTLMAGAPATLEIRADLFDNDGTNNVTAADTFYATLMAPASANTQRLSSLGYISVPGSNLNGNTLTAQSAASITMAKTATYGNQSVAVPQTTSHKMASWSLSGNSVEDVNLDTVAVNFTPVTNATFSAADLTNVILKIDGAVIGSPKSTVNATGDSFSVSKVLPKNGTITIEIWATIGSTITAADSMMVEATVSGVGASSSVASTTAAMVDGQVITAAVGSITATTDASRPDAALNDDTGTKPMAAFKFDAVTDSYTITDLTFTIADVTTASTLSLWDGATMVASKTAAATTTFNGLSWVIPAGSSKILTAKLDLATVGVGMGSTGASTLVTLTAGTATNGAGTSAPITESNPAGTAQYTYKSVPTLAVVALPTTTLVAGTNTLAKFSVNTNGTGTVGWNRIVFSIAKTSAPTLASFTLWNADSNTQIAGTATIVDTANAATCLATLLGCRVSFVPTTEQQVSGSVNYVLKATVAGSLATADYVTTNIAAPSSFAASAAYATVAATGGGFGTYAQSGTTPSFIWSDVSASSHSTTTADWSNDYLVRSLPLDSQTLTK